MKKLIVGVAALAVLSVAAIAGYRLLTPEIVVANASGFPVAEVIVELPSNRIVFGEILPGQESTIYYSASQADGVYNYSIRFGDALPVSGACGDVTGSEYGKRLRLVVHGRQPAECRESSKLF